MSKSTKTWSDDTPDDEYPPIGGRPAPRLAGAGQPAPAPAPSAAPAKAAPWAAKTTVAAVPLREVMSQEPVVKAEAPREVAPQRDAHDDGYQRRDGGDGGYQRRDGGDGGYQRRDGGDGGYQRRDGGDGGYQRRDGGDGGYQRRDGTGGDDRRQYDRPPREEVPIPDAPPYRVYVGKIPKETTEEDIGSMFAAMQLDCTNVVVIRHQDTQNARNAFATFSTREDLVEALKMNNQYPYDGAAMPIVVSPASAPPPGRDGGRDGRQGSERRGGGGGGFFSGDRFSSGGDSEKDWSRVRSGEQPSGGRDRGGDRDRPYGDRSSFSSQRPTLNLQPRTAPIDAVAGPAPSSAKSNPFGDAKPITEEERERRMKEARAERERAQASAAPAKDPSLDSAAPRRDAPGPRKEGDGRREGGAFQGRKDGAVDRHTDGPWQRGVEQKGRAPRDGPAADPMSPGWNAAKPSGKRSDRPAPQAAPKAAGAPPAAKGDAKASSNPFAALHVDSPTAEADE